MPIIFAIWANSLAHAQLNFNKVIFEDSIIGKTYVQLGLYNDYFFYIGDRLGTKKLSGHLLDYNGTVLQRLDSIGTDWLKSYKIVKESLIRVTDSTYAFIAYVNDYYSAIVEFNPETNRLEQKVGLDRNSESAVVISKLVKLPGGRVAIIEYDDGFWGGDQFTSINVYNDNWKRINSIAQGDSLSLFFHPCYFAQNADSTYTVTGELDDYSDPQYQKTIQFRRRFDPTLKLFETKYLDFKKDFRSSNANCIENKNRHLIYAGEAFFKMPDSLYYDNESLIIDVDPDFSHIVWQKKLNNPILNSSLHLFNRGLFQGSNASEFYTYGNIKRRLYDFPDNSYVYKFNEDGDSLWMRTYRYAILDTIAISGQYLLDGKLTKDNKLLFAGIGSDSFSKSYHTWLFQIDEEGCIIPDCNKLITKDPGNNPEHFITVYPSIVTNRQICLLSSLNINQNLEVSLYTREGRFLNRIQIFLEAGMQFILKLPDQLAYGNYIIRMIDDMGRNQTENIIITE